jgi:hypothetical protein
MEPSNEFERAAEEQGDSNLVQDFWYFLRESKKWWLLPIVVLLLLMSLLIVLAGSPAAPFIYPL